MLTIGVGTFLVVLVLLDRFSTFEHFLKSISEKRSNVHDNDYELNEPLSTGNGVSSTASTMENRLGFKASKLCKTYKNTISFWTKMKIRLYKICRKTKIEFNPVEAIKDVNFKVYQGACIGIIGENGAGKSTTMEIITGNLYKNDGKCVLYEKSENAGSNEPINLDVDQHRYKQLIGYCPQEETICEYMNGREFLSYLLMSKGYSSTQIKELVDRSMVDLDVKRFEDISLRDCSFGTKKKWNVAAAIVSEKF